MSEETMPGVRSAAAPGPKDVSAGAGTPGRARSSRWLWLVIGTLLVAAGLFAWQRQRSAGTGSRPPAAAGAPGASAGSARVLPVIAAVARKGDLPLYLDELGTVTALNTVTLRTRVDGQLVKVAFSEGQVVQAGDVVLEIDSRPFEVQLEQAQGQSAKDEALLKNARLDLQRYQEAHEAVSHQQIDTAAANVALYEGTVRVDQAAIDEARLQIAYCKISAPTPGRIGLRLVDQGNMVHASDANGLAVITQLQPIAVQFSLPQDSLPRVLSALAAGEVPIEAWNRDLSLRLASGKLSAVDNQIDTTTGTVKLKATFANEDGLLFPNQFVNVRLLVETQRGVVLVPQAAVQRSPQSMFVYVVQADDTVHARPVTLGATQGDATIVLQGLAEGERVVTDGVDKLEEGTKVVVREAGAKAAAAGAESKRPAGAKAQKD